MRYEQTAASLRQEKAAIESTSKLQHAEWEAANRAMHEAASRVEALEREKAALAAMWTSGSAQAEAESAEVRSLLLERQKFRRQLKSAQDALDLNRLMEAER